MLVLQWKELKLKGVHTYLKSSCRHLYSDVGDYLGINQTVTFEVEEVEKEVQVQIVDNAAVERVEQFSVFLTPLPGLFPVAVLNSAAVVSITDNDGMKH